MTALKRRRGLRMSLRTLFVLLTLLSIWLGFRANQAKRQRLIVDDILAIGGQVAYEHELDASLNSIAEPQIPGPKWLRDSIGDDYFVSVSSVGLRRRSQNQVRQRGHADASQHLRLPQGDAEFGQIIERLKWLPRLRRLSLGDIGVTDDALLHLKSLRHLESLDLYKNGITEKGIQDLSGLKKLKRLNISWTNVGDAGMETIGEFVKLEELYLTGTYITDKGLSRLQNLDKLTDVSLPNPTTDFGLQYVSRLNNLEKLLLNETQVAGPGLEHLTDLPKLNLLSLDDTLISDEALSTVSEMKNLTGEGLCFLAVTADAVDELHKRLPKSSFGVTCYTENIETAIQKLEEAGASIRRDNGSPRRRAVSLQWNNAMVPNEYVYDLIVLRHLRTLDLSGCELPLSNMDRFAGAFTRLRQLSLGKTNVTDAAINLLSRKTQLRELDLSDTQVSNESLPVLMKLYRLESLNVAGTCVTADAIADLQQALPGCKVTR